MQNRNNIIEEISMDFVLLKRRMLTGHHNPIDDKITPAQGQLMFFLHQRDGITTSEIARLLSITTSAATQLIDGLVKRGFIAKADSDDDRRVHKLTISTTAHKHLSKMKQEGLRRIIDLFSVLSTDELKTFKELIHKVVSQNFATEIGEINTTQFCQSWKHQDSGRKEVK